MNNNIDLQATKLNRTIAKNEVKNNHAPDIDVIQPEIALNQMITQVNSARVNVKKTLAEFNKVINDPHDIQYDSISDILGPQTPMLSTVKM